jgi:hypothetical protein
MTPSLALELREHQIMQEGMRITIGKALEHEDLLFAHADGHPINPNRVAQVLPK